MTPKEFRDHAESLGFGVLKDSIRFPNETVLRSMRVVSHGSGARDTVWDSFIKVYSVVGNNVCNMVLFPDTTEGIDQAIEYVLGCTPEYQLLWGVMVKGKRAYLTVDMRSNVVSSVGTWPYVPSFNLPDDVTPKGLAAYMYKHLKEN